MKKVLIGILSILLIACIGLDGYLIYTHLEKEEKTVVKEKKEKKEETAKAEQDRIESFNFMGVGDNLLHDVIFAYDEDGNYDDIYDPIKEYTEKSDLNYINYETICAGQELEYSGYPVFNGPVEFNDSITHAGFNWLSLCSNHTFDRGVQGVLANLNYIKEHDPQLTVTGSYTSKEESEIPTVVEINGIRVGLASYTYGLNGFELPEGYEWLINLIDEDKIRSDMEKLKEVSDIQIVSMHWGVEYETVPDEQQQYYAKLLNELGVEVIIGGHPHVVQPVEIIHGQNQDTLCYYSIGNFLSSQDHNENMVGGMPSFRLSYNFRTKETSFSDVKFTPTITWYDANYQNYKVYTIEQWTDDLAASHYCTVMAGEDMTKQWIADYFTSIVGNPEGVEIITE